MARFAGLPFVVIDDGTLPADTVPRLLPFATSVAVISAARTSDVAERFAEAGVPTTVHARTGELLRHAASHAVHTARHRAGPSRAEDDGADAAGGTGPDDPGDPRSLGHAVELAASEAMTIVVSGRPDDAEDWMRCALAGVSSLMRGGQVFVPMLVLADGELPEGPVVSMSAGDETAGYEEILAAGLAQRLERPVELITPAGRGEGGDTARRSETVAQAERLAHDAGVAWVRRELDDPLAEVLSRRDRIGAVVASVHDVAEGFELRPRAAVPPEAVASGSPHAVIEVLRGAPHDVLVVFDGVRLLLGAEEGRFVASGVVDALAETSEPDPVATRDPEAGDPAADPVGTVPSVPSVDIAAVRVPSPMAESIADPAHVMLDEPTFTVPGGSADDSAEVDPDRAASPDADGRPADDTGADILRGVALSLATIGGAILGVGSGRHRRGDEASVD